MDSELQQLVDSYKPNDQVLNMMRQINLLATVGPSASGKTTIMKELVSSLPNIDFVLDETSRKARSNETPGIDFLFRTKQDIIDDLKKGELVQVAIGPNGDLYCTRPSSYHIGKVSVVALVPAAIREFRKLPIGSFRAAFIVPASYDLWQEWLAAQATTGLWTPEQKLGRLREARESFEFALADPEMKFILNDELVDAAARLAQVANGQEPADQEKAKLAAQDNYKKLLAAYPELGRAA